MRTARRHRYATIRRAATLTLIVALFGLLPLSPAGAVTPAKVSKATRVWVADSRSNTVERLNPSSGKVDRVYGALIPQAVAVSPNGATVYAAGPGSTVRVVNECTGHETGGGPVGDSNSLVSSIATSPNGKYVYLTNPHDNLVITLNAAGHLVNSAGGPPEVGGARALAVSPNGQFFVTSGGSDGAIQVFNPGGKLVAYLTLFTLQTFHTYTEDAIAVDPANGSIYVAVDDNADSDVFNPAPTEEHLYVFSSTGQFRHDYTSLLGLGVEDLTFSPSGATLYVLYNNTGVGAPGTVRNTLQLVSTAKGTEISHFSNYGSSPIQMAVDSVSRILYVSDPGQRKVIVAAPSGKIIKKITSGGVGPGALAVSSHHPKCTH